MEKKSTENNPTNLWNRRANTHSSGKLSLSTNKTDRSDSHDTPSNRRVGSLSSHGNRNPFNSPSDLASPKATSAGAASFGLGSGAFGFGGASKTPKTPGASFDLGRTTSDKKDSSDENAKDSRRPPARKSLSTLRTPRSAVEPSARHPGDLPFKNGWVIYIRPPTSKNSDYEKSIKEIAGMHGMFEFWGVFKQLKHPSALPAVSDYHFFKKGIRPVWEDEANRKGGKWIMRLKKGVADRYWENLRFAMIGEQFDEANDEICGAVVSVRSGEDVISVWTKNEDGGKNKKVSHGLRRILELPSDTIIQWKSHDESITQRHTIDQARQEKANQEKRRNTLIKEEDDAAELAQSAQRKSESNGSHSRSDSNAAKEEGSVAGTEDSAIATKESAAATQESVFGTKETAVETKEPVAAPTRLVNKERVATPTRPVDSSKWSYASMLKSAPR